MKNRYYIQRWFAMFSIGSLMFFIPVAGWGMIASNVPGITVFGSQDNDVHIVLGPSLQMETGDMTSTIQGPENGGWKSRLEWSLDKLIYLGGVASVRFLGKYELTTGFWKSVAGGDGTLKDDDWFYGIYGNSRAVHSNSGTETDGLHVNLNFCYHVILKEGLVLSPIVGFSYTKWDWETRTGYQTSIDPVTFYSGPLEAGGVLYQEELYVPYIGLALSGLRPSRALDFHVYALYSPLARCDDEDDHVFRSKFILGEADGSFLSLGGDLRWKVNRSWSVVSNVTYTHYDLRGEQQQYFYAGTNPPVGTIYTGIDLKIEGSQTYFGLMITYEF